MKTEQEFKILLSRNEFNFIRQYLPFENQKVHINYYFDSEDFFCFRRNITVRVRKLNNNEYKLQVKTPIKNSCFTTKKEISKNLTQLPQNITYQMLYEMGIDCEEFDKNLVLTNLGNLKTIRESLYLNKCIVYLDKSIYFSTIDLELEIEFNDEQGYFDAKEIINNLGLSVKNKSIGKYNRFLNQLLKENFL